MANHMYVSVHSCLFKDNLQSSREFPYPADPLTFLVVSFFQRTFFLSSLLSLIHTHSLTHSLTHSQPNAPTARTKAVRTGTPPPQECNRCFSIAIPSSTRLLLIHCTIMVLLLHNNYNATIGHKSTSWTDGRLSTSVRGARTNTHQPQQPTQFSLLHHQSPFDLCLPQTHTRSPPHWPFWRQLVPYYLLHVARRAEI